MEITKGEFQQFLRDEKYSTLKNSAKGDCFFESIAQLLFDDIKKHVIVRQSVCDFHTGFMCGALPFVPFEDEFTVLTERSNKKQLINNLKYLLLQSADRENHSENVCNPTVYARDSELTAVCLLYKVNLKIFIEKMNSVEVNDLVYDNDAPTLNLHFVPGVESSDGGHYQAMKSGATRQTSGHATTQKKKTAVKNPKDNSKSKDDSKPKDNSKPKDDSKPKSKDNTIFNKTLKKRDSSEEKNVDAIKKMDLGVSSDEIRKAMNSAHGNPDKAVQSILKKLARR